MVNITYTDFDGYRHYRYMLFKSLDNGTWDIPAFEKTEYSKVLDERLRLCYEFEPDPMGEACLEWYRAHGLKKEMFENETHYGRWIMVSPIALKENKKYPVIFFHHNATHALEFDEFAPGFAEFAAEEGFFYVYLQNTNWQNTERVLDMLIKDYPIDPERVYMMGCSQGGTQVTSMCFERPERIAAAVPCGNDIFRLCDIFGHTYTKEEIAHLKEVFVPTMMIVGEREYGNMVPMNVWRDRYTYPLAIPRHPQPDPRRYTETDPTRPPVGRNIPHPPADYTQEEKDKWKIDILNLRLDSLNIEPRNMYQCLYYRQFPDSELHDVLGFYGDNERTEVYYGLKHWALDIYNRDGIDAFRYVVIENTVHQTPVTSGKLAWDFVKQFRRDSATGKIVTDPYVY